MISASGFVNYFGKNTDVILVRIPPLLFKKGESYMSLQGLSYMNEQRLSRLFRDEKVRDNSFSLPKNEQDLIER